MQKINLWGTYLASSILSFFLMADKALAEDVPQPLQLGFGDPATPQMERILAFHDDLLMWVITAIVIFVTALLIWVIARYNAKANPEPSKTTHNVPLEVIWTVVPVIILIIIAIPSFKMLYYLDRTENPELTLKVTGHQWYWSFEYQDYLGESHSDIAFDAYMLKDDELDPAKGHKRLLSTDNPVVLPIDTNIQILVTASDVIHSFTIPAFGFKKDAVPGRMNETWFRIDKPGTYYGQCSEICGKDHAFMPVEIKAVSKEEFEQWLIEAKDKFAAIDGRPLQIASIEGVQ